MLHSTAYRVTTILRKLSGDLAMALGDILARVDSLKQQVDALRPSDPEQEARLVQKRTATAAWRGC
jgi:hypothetical protein